MTHSPEAIDFMARLNAHAAEVSAFNTEVLPRIYDESRILAFRLESNLSKMRTDFKKTQNEFEEWLKDYDTTPSPQGTSKDISHAE